MHPAGQAEVERAKADGRWDAAYAGQASIEVPPDLAEALAAEPKAQAMFEALNSQNRYAVLYRITTAKRSDTRARQIEHVLQAVRRCGFSALGQPPTILAFDRTEQPQQLLPSLPLPI